MSQWRWYKMPGSYACWMVFFLGGEGCLMWVFPNPARLSGSGCPCPHPHTSTTQSKQTTATSPQLREKKRKANAWFLSDISIKGIGLSEKKWGKSALGLYSRLCFSMSLIVSSHRRHWMINESRSYARQDGRHYWYYPNDTHKPASKKYEPKWSPNCIKRYI